MAKISSNPVGCPALKVTTLHNFNAALNAPEVCRFDLLLLDARLGPYSGIPDEEAGITTLQAIRQRRFIPVVFYTGLPHLVRDLVTPLIQVVEKTAELPRLLDSLSSIFATRLPAVNRALIRKQSLPQALEAATASTGAGSGVPWGRTSSAR